MRSPRVWSGYEFVVPYEITQRHWAAHPLTFSPFLSNPQQICQAQCLVLLLIFFYFPTTNTLGYAPNQFSSEASSLVIMTNETLHKFCLLPALSFAPFKTVKRNVYCKISTFPRVIIHL